ncbi:MAG: helix-hairpin-helix domain-containing protein [Deltaproteobacteria bacterium]|nr:helix-hairpin-helix domain-containing protein [Deltaproteobacteria bacterium]
MPRMRLEHLVVTLAIILVGYGLCGLPEGNVRPGVIQRSPRAWNGAPPGKKARLVRLEGDLERPGIYLLESGEPIDEVLREAGVRGTITPSLPGRITSGTALVLRTRNGEARVVSIKNMPPLERLILGLPLDLNTIEAGTLSHLPGIGPFLAGRILAERNRRGRFRSLSELESVPGIGPVIRKKAERYLEVVQPFSVNHIR